MLFSAAHLASAARVSISGGTLVWSPLSDAVHEVKVTITCSSVEVESLTIHMLLHRLPRATLAARQVTCDDCERLGLRLAQECSPDAALVLMLEDASAHPRRGGIVVRFDTNERCHALLSSLGHLPAGVQSPFSKRIAKVQRPNDTLFKVEQQVQRVKDTEYADEMSGRAFANEVEAHRQRRLQLLGKRHQLLSRDVSAALDFEARRLEQFKHERQRRRSLLFFQNDAGLLDSHNLRSARNDDDGAVLTPLSSSSEPATGAARQLLKEYSPSPQVPTADPSEHHRALIFDEIRHAMADGPISASTIVDARAKLLTQIASLVRPDTEAAASPAPSNTPAMLRMKGDWKELRDAPSGRLFYLNVLTQRTTWDVRETPFAPDIPPFVTPPAPTPVKSMNEVPSKNIDVVTSPPPRAPDVTPSQSGQRAAPVLSKDPTPAVPVPSKSPAPAAPVPSKGPTPAAPVPSKSPAPAAPVPSKDPTPAAPVPSKSPTPAAPVPSKSPAPEAKPAVPTPGTVKGDWKAVQHPSVPGRVYYVHLKTKDTTNDIMKTDFGSPVSSPAADGAVAPQPGEVRGKWKALQDKTTGRLYYAHTETKATTYNINETDFAVQVANVIPNPGDVRGKWKAVKDPTSGRLYYYNTSTKETTYDIKKTDFSSPAGVSS